MPTTQDHNQIMEWAKQRDAHPAVVEGTGQPEGLLRFDFGEPNENLRRIDWDEFFRIFDERDLSLLFDEKPKSRFHKFTYSK